MAVTSFALPDKTNMQVSAPPAAVPRSAERAAAMLCRRNRLLALTLAVVAGFGLRPRALPGGDVPLSPSASCGPPGSDERGDRWHGTLHAALTRRGARALEARTVRDPRDRV